MADRVVIVGASLGGLRAAEALRAAGFAGSVTLIGAEDRMPYDRPPLSKQVLTGKADADSVGLPVDDGLGLTFRLGTPAAGLDVDGRAVVLADGSRVPYDRLVLATGAHPRILADLPPGPGVHYLRTIDDSLSLRDDLATSEGLAVIGAGFIGLEVACSARALGVPVTVLEALPVPLERALGVDMGRSVLEWHLSKGLDVRTGTGVAGLSMSASGRPSGVVLADGSTVAADTVVVGVGVAPTTGWLDGSGVQVADGIIGDDRLRVRADDRTLGDTVAVGDAVRWTHPDYLETVRVEHWTHATESAEYAARVLLQGDAAPAYNPVPYFWSDQHGVKLQFVGRAAAGDDLAVLEGSFAEDRVLVAYGRAGRLVAALGIRRPARVMAMQRLIAEGAPFPPD